MEAYVMWLYVIICIVGWGTWGVAEKLASKHMNPLAIQLVASYIWSAIAPLLFVYMRITHVDTTMNVKGVVWTTAATVLSFISITSFIKALQVPGVDTYVFVGLTSVYPAFTFLLCVTFLGEQVTFVKIVGVFVVCFGAWLLSL